VKKQTLLWLRDGVMVALGLTENAENKTVFNPREIYRRLVL
jgi:hypothetical protein